MRNVGKLSCFSVWVCTSVAPRSTPGLDASLHLLPLPTPPRVGRKPGRWAAGTRDILQPLPHHRIKLGAALWLTACWQCRHSMC